MVVREEALAERLALLRSTVLRLQAAAARQLDDEWDEWALERGLQSTKLGDFIEFADAVEAWLQARPS